MRSLLVPVSLFAFAALCSACSDGQTGDNGTLRFGQLYQFAESSDFSTPIARGQKMPIGVQWAKKTALLNEYDYVDGQLEIRDAAEQPLSSVERVDRGKFQAVFPATGSHTLVARFNGEEDRLSVAVEEQAGLRLAEVTVIHSANGKTCGTHVQADNAIPTLRSGDTLTFNLVPHTAAGAPLLGILDLSTAPSGVELEASPSVANIEANEFLVRPLSATGSVRFTDKLTGQFLDVNVTMDPSLQPSCP